MRPSVRRSAALVTTAAALLAACSGGGDGGGDDGGPTGGALTAREASTVAAAVFTELSRALTDVEVARAPAARLAGGRALRAAAEGLSGTISGDCQRGGRVTLAYSYTDNMNDAGTGTLTGTMTLTPQGCVVSTGERDISVDGAPSLTYTYSAAFTEGEPSGSSTWRGTGGLSWSGGNCAMDYTVTLTPQGSARASGTVCGQNVDQTFGAD